MNESQEWADLVVAVATEKLNNAELTEYREQVELEWMRAHDASEAANEAADLANEALEAAEAKLEEAHEKYMTFLRTLITRECEVCGIECVLAPGEGAGNEWMSIQFGYSDLGFRCSGTWDSHKVPA